MARSDPTSPRVTPEAEQLAELTLGLLEHCQSRMTRMAAALNLTVAEFRLLRVFRSDAALDAGQLARRIGLSPSRLTRILDGLESARLVTRQPEPYDRRVTRVTLTQKGLRVQGRLRETLTRTNEEILRLLPAGGAAAVLLALRRLNEAMARWDRD